MRRPARLPADVLADSAARLEFEFTLQVELAEHDLRMESLLLRLDAVGCSEALVGAGATCTVELQFITSARTAAEALRVATEAVERAFQGARVTRIVPAPDTPTAGVHELRTRFPR